jgi:hypothetical protein
MKSGRRKDKREKHIRKGQNKIFPLTNKELPVSEKNN